MSRSSDKISNSLLKFSVFIEQNLSRVIYSVLLTGSLARFEKTSKQSDIDLIIVFHKTGKTLASKLFILKKGIQELEKNSSLEVSPQIFNKKDLFQLLSPSLYKMYSIDSKVVYGHNLKPLFIKKVSKLSQYEFEVSVLKRVLFSRYFLRQSLMTTQDSNYFLAKSVFFLASHYLYMKKGMYFTKRDELKKNWTLFFKEKIVAFAIDVIDGDMKVEENKSLKMIIFIEQKTDEVFRLMENKYPDRKIDIGSF